LFPDPLVSVFTQPVYVFSQSVPTRRSVSRPTAPTSSFRFQLSRFTLSDLRRTRPQLPTGKEIQTSSSVVQTADPDPRSVGIRLWLCKIRFLFSAFSAPQSTSPLPPVKVDNHGNSFLVTVQLKPIPVGTATVVLACTPPCLLLCDGTAPLDFKPPPLLYKYRQQTTQAVLVSS
jgi:hypothetical protein